MEYACSPAGNLDGYPLHHFRQLTFHDIHHDDAPRASLITSLFSVASLVDALKLDLWSALGSNRGMGLNPTQPSRSWINVAPLTLQVVGETYPIFESAVPFPVVNTCRLRHLAIPFILWQDLHWLCPLMRSSFPVLEHLSLTVADADHGES